VRRKKEKPQAKRQKPNAGKTVLNFKLWFCLLPFSFYLGFGAAPVSFAAEDPLTDDTVVVKSEGPHRLLLPSDWPVEHKDGRYAPVSMEEYLSMKFGQVREKFGDTEQRLEALERRLEQVERDTHALLKGLKFLEERINAQEERHGSQAKGQ